ncbi:MAG: helix-turn-helix domain-containing protein [Hungatella sp.]|jgi:putative transcriptional regulator|nr:helix-turn-helix domain-containing protein [Hungatella sp.]MCI9500993.1 helix-turn-helix domain-containing protein [Hungatella sp.]MCI9635733.1 helix-turn-helix domain-containing protein [Hungatella sp.]
MGQQTYYNPKNGKGNLGGETLEKLCGLVNCQPGALMEYVPDTKEPSAVETP